MAPRPEFIEARLSQLEATVNDSTADIDTQREHRGAIAEDRDDLVLAVEDVKAAFILVDDTLGTTIGTQDVDALAAGLSNIKSALDAANTKLESGQRLEAADTRSIRFEYNSVFTLAANVRKRTDDTASSVISKI